MKTQNLIIVLTALFAFSISSCKKDDDTPSGKYSSGVFITNEGPFGTGTGTVSFINRDSNNIENNIF